MVRIASTLYRLALEHDGVFTAREATAAGITPGALVMAARRGTVASLSRGIYRLANFPSREERVQLWEAVLWPTVGRSPSTAYATLSHLSALRLHNASLEYTPPKVSITIEPGARIRRAPPPWVDLHVAALPQGQITEIDTLPVTTLERTLLDCIAIHVDRRLIESTLHEARNLPFGNDDQLTHDAADRIRRALR